MESLEKKYLYPSGAAFSQGPFVADSKEIMLSPVLPCAAVYPNYQIPTDRRITATEVYSALGRKVRHLPGMEYPHSIPKGERLPSDFSKTYYEYLREWP